MSADVPARLWGRCLAALRQLQVPADTAADLQDLIRIVSRLQAISGEGGTDNRLRAADVRYQIRWDNVWPKIWPAATRVRSDLRPAGASVLRPRRARPALRLVSLTGGAHVLRLLRPAALADHSKARAISRTTSSSDCATAVHSRVRRPCLWRSRVSKAYGSQPRRSM